MKNLLLIAITILAVGCGGKDESTTETKPIEEKVVEVKPTEEAPLNPNLKYEIKGDSSPSLTVTKAHQANWRFLLQSKVASLVLEVEPSFLP